jgi:membrane associated rhomboid family serine protease/Zn-finger nucleic acid-binding protein
MLLCAAELAARDDIQPELAIQFRPREVIRTSEIDELVLNCPRCCVRLEKFNYAYDSNIILDKCPKCDGMWTDGGEIQKVAKHIKQYPQMFEIGKSIITNEALEDIDKLGEAATDLAFILHGPEFAIPLGDDIKRQRTPIATIGIISLCCLLFIMFNLISGRLDVVTDKLGFVPIEFFRPGLLTSMFIHAGLIHLVGNMLFLWVFGDNVEDELGSVGFLLFYLGSGVAACILHALLNLGSEVPCVGASGAISGVMGAYVVFYPQASIKLFYIRRVVEVSAVYYLLSWFGFQLLSGFLSLNKEFCNIGWFAHIGGFAFGVFVAFIMKRFAESNSHAERI